MSLEVARNGEEALHFLRNPVMEAPPDLIILDLNLPRRDGRSVLREIRKDPALKSLPVIILTTSAYEQDVRICCELKADSYIKKPDNWEGFSRLIAEVKRLLPAVA